jgi:hypothetical protein
LFASSMPNAHPWWWPFICKLDAQCTSMSVACHLQAQCSMCIHEGNLSFVSSKHNVHVSTRGFLAADEMRKRFSWMCYCCSCCFNVCYAICFQRWIDWIEDLLLWKVHRSLSVSSPPAATTMRSTLDSRRKSQWVCLSRTADS